MRLVAEAGLEAGLDPSVPPVDAELIFARVGRVNELFGRKVVLAACRYPGLARGHLGAQGLPRTVATTSKGLPASGEAAVPSR